MGLAVLAFAIPVAISAAMSMVLALSMAAPSGTELAVCCSVAALLAVQLCAPLTHIAFDGAVARIVAPPTMALTATILPHVAITGGAQTVSIWLAILIALTTVLFDRLGVLFGQLTNRHDSGSALSFLLLAIVIAAPLWLGRLPELQPGQELLNSLPLMASPLAWVSSALGFDIMRSTWFYQHASFGAARYAYASIPATATACLVIGTSLTLATEWLRRRRRARKGEYSQ